MKEFSAKKLGEVLAFARSGKSTFKKGREALEEVFSSDEIDLIIETNQQHQDQIEEIAEEAGVSEEVLEKAKGTESKLDEMRELYIKDEWDDPAEVLEWLGCFEGGAIVHWSLVEGAANNLGLEDLKVLCQEGLSSHKRILEQITTIIKEV